MFGIQRIFILLILTLCIYGDDITLCAEHNPPYSFVDNDRVTGLAIDIANESFQAESVAVNFIIYPPKRCVLYCNNNEVSGIIGTTSDVELFNGEVFSNPLYTIFLNPMVTLDSPLLEDSILDWMDYKIGVVSGIGFEELYPLFDFEFATSVDLNVRKFFAGRFDVLLENHAAVSYFIEEHLPEQANDYVVLDPPLLETPISIGFTEESNDEFHLDSVFNAGLEVIKQNGVYDSLMIHWLE